MKKNSEVAGDGTRYQEDCAPVFDARQFLSQLAGSREGNKPGIYQMFDRSGNILYVGKAKALKKRLASYFNKNVALKTRSLVEKIHRIEVTITQTETEALLLEQNLIKQQRPPYNILLRDDKSYPYIFISTEDEYPRIDFHRGSRRQRGRYFGPYPGAASVRESLQFLQKTFRLRQCEDSFFRHRSRPCLQYQIKRCTAPCVELISPEDYAEDLHHAIQFLEGCEEVVMQELADRMEAAAQSLAYEQAAKYRDQIAHLRYIQEPQSIEEGISNVDVLAVAVKSGHACVQVMTVRSGRILGSRSYYPEYKLDCNETEILHAFLLQYYLQHEDRDIPREMILGIDAGHADEEQMICSLLEEKSAHKVVMSHAVRSQRAKWQTLAHRAAEQNVLSRLATQKSQLQRFERLQEVLQLDDLPERIECFDISHSSGEATVASCVVFDVKGAVKSDYRRFNIVNVAAGDDYAAMQQALLRRYTRLQKEATNDEESGEESRKVPDIVLIDGGKGQYTQAENVIRELQLPAVKIVAVAKGTTRKAGFETLVMRIPAVDTADDGEWKEVVLDSHDPALHLIQQVRDEAHRFAVTGHQQRRDKQRRESRLESIPGVGAKRRRELLRFFGGQQEIARAGIDELARVPGISRALAELIYEAYREK
jgi:excinuclease ABC subunit C